MSPKETVTQNQNSFGLGPTKMTSVWLLLLAAAAGGTDRPTGHLIQWLVDAAGLPEVPAEYLHAVAALRELRVVKAAWVRPGAGSLSEVSSMTKAGLFYKVPPHLRLVPEECCPWKHVALASMCQFPDKSAVGHLEGPVHRGHRADSRLGQRLGRVAHETDGRRAPVRRRPRATRQTGPRPDARTHTRHHEASQFAHDRCVLRGAGLGGRGAGGG